MLSGNFNFLFPLSTCVILLDLNRSCHQEGNFQVSSSLILPIPMSKMFVVCGNGVLPSSSGRKSKTMATSYMVFGVSSTTKTTTQGRFLMPDTGIFVRQFSLSLSCFHMNLFKYLSISASSPHHSVLLSLSPPQLMLPFLIHFLFGGSVFCYSLPLQLLLPPNPNATAFFIFPDFCSYSRLSVIKHLKENLQPEIR